MAITDMGALDDLCQRALALQAAGRPELAEPLYRDVLAADPDHALANHGLGMVHLQAMRSAQGLPHLLAALNAEPQVAEYWLGYLEALLGSGDPVAAREALALGRAHGLSGPAVEDLARRLGDAPPPPAVSAAPATPSRAPAQRKPLKPGKVAQLHRQQSATLHGLITQRRLDEALELAGAMTREHPSDGLAWKRLGGLLWWKGRSSDAFEPMRRAVELMPADAEARSNLGMALLHARRADEATESFRRAIKLDPRFAAAHYHLGMMELEAGRYAEAQQSLMTAVKLRPDYLTADVRPAFSDLLFLFGHDAGMGAQELYAEHCRYGESFEAPLRGAWPRHANDRDPQRQLRVGFVSGDFRDHAMATFIEPVLAQLGPRAGLALHAYSNAPAEDAVTARLRGHFAHWRVVSALSDAALAAQIIGDRIDILIDLSGHTGLNRLPVFARKPAPIQLSWMGYPGTTGLRAMDYYLTDPQWLPPGQFDDQFTEKLVYLPANAPFQPHPAAPPVNTLPALHSGTLTFGSFNRLGKINAATVQLWSSLLRALPDARLLLGGMPSGAAQDELLARFAAQGIAPERLTCLPRCAMDAYLALHHRVDLCLDTYPYTGGTTTLHALWMGVPTLTWAGATPAGRQGAAILAPIGLDEFIAADAADFVARGVGWAGRLDALANLRTQLRARLQDSPTRSPSLIANSLELALRRMWHRWCMSLPAESFMVTDP